MNLDKLVKIISEYKDNFPIYAESCLWITTKDKRIIPLKLNKAQVRLWQIIKESIDAGKPVRIIVLKARQLGISTFIQGLLFWLVTLTPNTNALVVAHDTESTQTLFSKQDLFYKKLPDYIKPLQKFNSVRELYFANPDPNSKSVGLQSRVLVKSADNKDLGASYTLHGAHLSELALWEEKGLDIKARLVNLNAAMPNLPFTFSIIETTARGDGYFRSMWEDEESSYQKLFISWVADENYRIPLDYGEVLVLDKHDNDVNGDEETEYTYVYEQVKLWYTELKNESDIVSEVYARLKWRRHCIKNACEKDVTLFQQEYPTIPQQAFASTGSNVFNLQALEKISKLASNKAHYFYFNEGIEDRLRNAKTSNKKALLNICREGFYSQATSPNIKLNPSFDLCIYEPPINGRKYVIGCDVAEGYKDGDFSSLVMLRLPNLEEVATFNKIIDPNIFGYLLYCLGRLYNDALIGVEINDRGSVSVIRVLTHDLFYPNVYQREAFSTTKHTNKLQTYGWKTTKYTKPMMISDANNAIKDEVVKLNNYHTIKQLMRYKKFADGSTGILAPGHDDLALSFMIAIQMVLTIPEEKQKEKPKLQPNTLAYIEKQMEQKKKARRLK